MAYHTSQNLGISQKTICILWNTFSSMLKYKLMRDLENRLFSKTTLSL